MIALLACIALGGPPVGGTAEGPVLAEPILTYARLDTQELAFSRVYGLQSLGTPLVLGMGVFAHFHQAARVGVDQRFQRAGRAGAITASGAQIAMATAPILLRGSAERSRRALVAQGLRPRRAPRVTFGSTFAATLLLATSLGGIRRELRS